MTTTNSSGSFSASVARARFAALLLIIGALAAAALWAHADGRLTVEGIRTLVDRGGAFSPLVYVVVASLLIVAWAPRFLLSMVAGVLFDVALGTALALTMGTLGALGGYSLGRALGLPYVEHKTAGRSVRVLEFIRRRGFWAVLTCRVCPLVPSELISVTSGTTGIPMPGFVVASILGMAPGAFLYAAFGASLLDPDAAWITWSTVAGFAVLTVGTAWTLAHLWRRDASP